jgi:tripartite-type tricarboxylate transporter receptor subunit TctC
MKSVPARMNSVTRVLALVAAMLPPAAYAQGAYPTQTVRFIVPFPASTPPDLLARIASQKMAESWRTPVIVEVRDGAGGMIGISQVVKAAPDGHTLLFTPDFPLVIAPAVSKVPYEPRRDLAPIAAVARDVSVLVAHPSLGIGSLRELVAAAKARPGALTFASGGDGSPSRMCIEFIRQQAGIDVVQIPYRGAAPAIQALLAGDVSMYCSPTFQALPHIRSGKLKALGITGAKPNSLIPGVAPLSAQGLPDAVFAFWFAAFAPSGTSPEVLKKIRDALKRAFDDSDVREKLASLGLDPIWMDEVQLASSIRSDLERWTRVAKTAGIKPE